jgi:hypothetical protein
VVAVFELGIVVEMIRNMAPRDMKTTITTYPPNKQRAVEQLLSRQIPSVHHSPFPFFFQMTSEADVEVKAEGIDILVVSAVVYNSFW